MAADSQELWIYTEFLNVYRDYVLYLQQMGILLITAISVIFFKNRKNQNTPFYLTIYTAFLLAIVNLFVGLCIYSNILGLILDVSQKLPDLTSLKFGVYWQFGLEIASLIVFVVSIFFIKKEN
ncbi:hypothetical protein [Legionella pneumophila]|uniref:hypothetical protein n=1 Tax=Legionella pneumophila TaxID=446 RepID=UPI000770875B|nr:hypothetical protein [Legionella pneumophila]CZG73307.1 Uncharacterised protein [Legionella pneumophila]HAT1980649.1 hypothetical protein [Legionella pneumophila]HAT4424082.1 hypothetical protein [Legionella pneumophila]HAU1720234.1 hypothetical protein [Legionella pneumophila]HBD7142402.1 hypothetical protein [Legionella pneumophila]